MLKANELLDIFMEISLSLLMLFFFVVITPFWIVISSGVILRDCFVDIGHSLVHNT